MSSEETGETVTVVTEGAAVTGSTPASDKSFKCPLGEHHVHREDVRKAFKECQEESFWYRALPISVGSMAVTSGLIYNGVWKPSPRFGYFPKVIAAGILGYAVGKLSYVGACRSKFQELGIKPGPGGSWGAGGPGFGPWGSRRGHRPCGHVCEECKKKEASAPAATQPQS